jgi:hypothetical protein
MTTVPSDQPGAEVANRATALRHLQRTIFDRHHLGGLNHHMTTMSFDSPVGLIRKYRPALVLVSGQDLKPACR